ncbi:YafY family protein [Phycicoccus sp. Root101]|uniref:helix-turn-helix transcriptional regulator n=1 Tax=Phycicoccus sp. Root101 TaxID=1736421 RepID=UPI0007035E0C|nr:WYL domain-containing protein [Phycicoccus sp. Root101]KQU68825.1 DNA-binding protein [Phycicoccus sp. Root101]
MDTTNPTARALLCLELLQDSPGITADRLGERLGVTSRAARRYVGILREAGIPVQSTRGPYGGYRVGRGLRLPPLTFSSAEALGLVMAVLDGHHDAGNPADPVGSALAKILRALPDSVAAQADAVRRTAASAPDRAAARPDPTTAATLVDASAEHHRVRVTYHSESGRTWDVEVDPWAVVVRHGRWYLLCLTRPTSDEAAVRTYRVDRVSAVEVLDLTFTPPPDLDPVALLERHLATGWEYAVDVLVEAPVEIVSHWLPRALGRLELVDERTTRLVGTTSSLWWYAEQLAVLRAPFRIVGCTELQEVARAVGAQLLAAGTPGGAGQPQSASSS